jgi:hypothetical protein
MGQAVSEGIRRTLARGIEQSTRPIPVSELPSVRLIDERCRPAERLPPPSLIHFPLTRRFPANRVEPPAIAAGATNEGSRLDSLDAGSSNSDYRVLRQHVS